jgi:hypothetical protein
MLLFSSVKGFTPSLTLEWILDDLEGILQHYSRER